MSSLLLIWLNKFRGCRKSGSFTLIEVLLAVAITGIIAGVIYSSLRGVMKTVEDARARMEISRTARGVLWSMSWEINNCIIGEYMEFVGESEGMGDADMLCLSFCSAGGGPGTEHSDVRQVEYGLSEKILYKSINGVVFAVAEKVDSLELRYFDGAEWQRDWDSEAREKLPLMVEIDIEIQGEFFSTAVSVPVAAGHIK